MQQSMFMLNKLKCLAIIFIAILLSSSILKQHSDAITNGDKYFALMRYRDAISWYTLDSTSAVAQWKIAKANICYGDVAPPIEKEQYFRAGEKAAQKCILIDPSNSNGYTWRAAAFGNIAMYEGSTARVQLCTRIKTDLLKAIQLNSKDDIAYSILGSLYREIGNISWVEKKLALTFIGKIPDGGYPESEQCLNKAISINPQLMRHWYELGLLYTYWDKPEKAISAFEHAKACSVLIASDNNKLIDIEKRISGL
jgi:tetratricopeptide (TPR) repeat protein